MCLEPFEVVASGFNTSLAVTTLFLSLPQPIRRSECLNEHLPLLNREQIKADMVTYTSDRFEEFKEYALGMIKKGEAYMDDTPQVEYALLAVRVIGRNISEFLCVNI